MLITNRREFLSQSSAALVGLDMSAASGSPTASRKMASSVSGLTRPGAIAMWDFSWLLRHYPTGEFENWDSVLDGLVKRGYNAIRLDVFPALVAPDPEGRVIQEHQFPKSDWKPVMWGAQYSPTIRPRRALQEFIPRCLERGLLLGLSTWFFGSGVDRIEGTDGFVRVWDQTLAVLKENDLLHNVYYVNLLNEYALFHGFSWLTRQLDKNLKQQEEKARAEGVHEWKAKPSDYSDEASREFYTGFANEALARMQAKWPELDFLFSLTYNGSARLARDGAFTVGGAGRALLVCHEFTSARPDRLLGEHPRTGGQRSAISQSPGSLAQQLEQAQSEIDRVDGPQHGRGGGAGKAIPQARRQH